ncbi:MAG: glycosyltransferase family 2 protein [Patescibacteria group bacterium]
MRLSIVVPTLNQGKFISQTLESLLQQDGGIDLEILIMDGGSTDKTPSVIQEYTPKLKHQGYRIINISEPDEGQSDAINKGFTLATGDILTYLNSDDYLEPGVVKKVIERFAAPDHPNWGYGGWRYVDIDRRIYKTIQPTAYSHRRLQVICNIMQPSCIYRRDFLFRVGILNKDLHLAMDYDLWLRMAENCGPTILPWIISDARYYMDTKSSTRGIEHIHEAFRLQRRYSSGLGLRLLQTFYFLRGLAVTYAKLDINHRIEMVRKHYET